MARLVSNSGGKDVVRSAFERMAWSSKLLRLAAPYFTYTDMVLEALQRGSSIDLLVGLNTATHPDALAAVFSKPRVNIRFYTGRFHAKLFVFDDAAIVGSANLTEAGFQRNREVVACFTEAADEQEVHEARVIFRELWEGARSLSKGTLSEFRVAWMAARQKALDLDNQITAAVGKIEPPTISVERRAATATAVAAERLRRQIEEEYRPAFDEVGTLLSSQGLFRSDVNNIEIPFRINRFLNWVRLTHAPKETWKDAPLRESAGRRTEVIRFAQEWKEAADGRVDEGYAEGILDVLAPFANPSNLAIASKEQLTAGLMGIHAFHEQLRFTTGGEVALPAYFWDENGGDLEKVRRTLSFLLHGHGDFVGRLYAVISDPQLKLAKFGRFCALELSGTVKPSDCPPVNGRSAKALRFLGYRVAAT